MDDEPVAAAWVVGTPETRAASIARQLAGELDLPWHPLEHYALAHRARLEADGVEPPSTTGEEADAEAEADAVELMGDRLMPLIDADLRAAATPGVPVVVEGSAMRPDHVSRWGPAAAIWLVGAPELAPSARDRVLAHRLDVAARRHALPLVTVGVEPDWAAVTDAVRRTLLSALTGHRALLPGAELAIRRQHENDVVARQLKTLRVERGITPPPYAFACTCGRSGCTDTEVR